MKVNENGCCTIIGNTPLPHSKVSSWNIKILKSRDNDGNGIFVGIASFDINQDNRENYQECGWYFNCYGSKLCSGPPHNYDDQEYGLRKENGKYVHTGSIIGVMMDTTKGEPSFDVGEGKYTVAYGMVPLDKPLVPCVILYFKGDYVKFIPNWSRPSGTCLFRSC